MNEKNTRLDLFIIFFLLTEYVIWIERNQHAKKLKKKLSRGGANMDFESIRFRNILTRQDRQFRMPGSCHADKFQPSLLAPKKLFRATLNYFFRNAKLRFASKVVKYFGFDKK